MGARKHSRNHLILRNGSLFAKFNIALADLDSNTDNRVNISRERRQSCTRYLGQPIVTHVNVFQRRCAYFDS